ncbi:hypothetical protein Tco_1172345 [Tanacetum coccineum]
MSKLLYTRFTKIIIAYLLSFNKSIPHRSDSKLHSLQDDHPITKLLNTTNDDYKFGMEVLDAMISDAMKKKAGYTYYMAKKVESEKAKIINEPKEQHVSLIKSGRGKGFMCYGDEVANVPNKLKKDFVPRKTRSLTISLKKQTDEAVADMYNKWGKTQRSGNTDSDATLCSSSSDKPEGSANETDDADESYMDLFDDNPDGDDDDASSLQAKAKKLMQKAKKNIRKFNFKKAVAQKFKEYDQKLEDLTNFNISEAFEKAVKAKVLIEIKKLLHTHISNAIANYVKPRLNTSVLEVIKTNQINLFTQSSTSTDDLLEMDLKLKLLNRIPLEQVK